MILNTIIFVFGLLIGSFLNAVIYRLDSGESIVKERSHCPGCGHVLSWYELIPLISFIILKGKCKECRGNISWQYPLVEIGTAILFLLVIFNFQFLIFKQFSIFEFLNPAYYLAITSLLIIIFVYDLKHYIIPDKIVYPAIVTAFLYQLFNNLSFGFDLTFDFWLLALKSLLPIFLSALLASAFFAAIFFASKGKWLGFGDVKLVFFMGLILSWPNILVALFVAFLLGGIIGVGLIALGKKNMKSQVPFGPFLVSGTFVALFWGGGIVQWYLGLIGF